MLARSLLVLALIAAPAQAFAWGAQGHSVVAALARSYLTPQTKDRIDALLATDTDTLATHDMLAQAPWADLYRRDHNETTEWHFVDIELEHPDVAAACFGFPAPLTPASKGPEKDCIIGRLNAFEKELADPKTPQAERLMALKFVLHFVGDIHQPLHASNHEDRGGNCVLLNLGGPQPVNLHTYWDSTVLRQIAPTNGEIAGKLKAAITPADRAAWSKGDARAWAEESYKVALSKVYTFKPPPGCPEPPGPALTLPADYEAQTRETIERQLQMAGVRLAWVLEQAFARG